MERADPSRTTDIAREQGVLKGLRIAVVKMEEMRTSKGKEDEDE